jgi:trehalose-6-phosphatase
VSLLTARYRLAEEAEREFARIGRKGSEGRTFVDVVTLRQVLVLRERGVEEGEIERSLGLGRGVVGRLGRRGVVGVGG